MSDRQRGVIGNRFGNGEGGWQRGFLQVMGRWGATLSSRGSEQASGTSI